MIASMPRRGERFGALACGLWRHIGECDICPGAALPPWSPRSRRRIHGGGLEPFGHRAGSRRLLLHPRQPQEQLSSAGGDIRRSAAFSARRHSFGAGGLGDLVHGSANPRRDGLESEAPAPDANLQVLHLPYGLAAAARTAAKRYRLNIAPVDAFQRACGRPPLSLAV